MYRILLAVALHISPVSFSQDTNRARQDNSGTIISNNLFYSDSLQKAEDIQRMTYRSVSYFAELQRQRNAKQKRKTMLYIAIGLAGLIVLVAGLRRKVKK
jgi:hypothetical protein